MSIEAWVIVLGIYSGLIISPVVIWLRERMKRKG